jgi:hypothetical protein
MSPDVRAEVEEIVRDVLVKLLTAASAPAVSQGGWVSLKDAVVPLGYPSYKALHKDVAVGLFRLGKEIRDRRKPGAKVPRLQINIEKAQKRLSESQENRRSV